MHWDMLELDDSNDLYSTEAGEFDDQNLEEIATGKQKDPRRMIEIIQEKKQLSKELFDFFN